MGLILEPYTETATREFLLDCPNADAADIVDFDELEFKLMVDCVPIFFAKKNKCRVVLLVLK